MEKAVPEKLADWRPAGAGPHSLDLPMEHGEWTGQVAAQEVDSIGCRVNELTASRSGAESMSPGELDSWTRRCAEKVSGLLEPLRAYEVDASRGEAILRSDKPRNRGDHVEYFELKLTERQEARLRRYRAQKIGGSREQIPFSLTHESIAKVMEDVAEASSDQ